MYVRFPVDSSQIPKGVVYFSPGCQMTLSPIVPWHPQLCWPFDQRHPVIRAKKHPLILVWFAHLVTPVTLSVHHLWGELLLLGKRPKKTMQWVRLFLSPQIDYNVFVFSVTLLHWNYNLGQNKWTSGPLPPFR